jgi:O-antigen/teichoic acid export membrane protein
MFVAINSAEITRLVLGRKWLGCAQILGILSLGTFVKAPVGWSPHILVSRGQSKMYLGLALTQNITLIALMLIGVHWGIVGVATADVATTYLLAAPILYFSFKGSPVTVGTFFSTVARPGIASIIMAIVLKLFREAVPPLGAPAFLMLAGLLAAAVFIGTWMLLPGGKAELMALVSDVRSALRRKIQSRKTVEPVPVAG